MSSEQQIQQILNMLNRLERTLDGVRDDISAIRDEHGQRLVRLETTQVGTMSRLPDVERDMKEISSALAALPAMFREEMTSCMAAERSSVDSSLAVERQRIDTLELDLNKRRGATLALSAVWAIVVAIPGVAAFLLRWNS